MKISSVVALALFYVHPSAAVWHGNTRKSKSRDNARAQVPRPKIYPIWSTILGAKYIRMLKIQKCFENLHGRVVFPLRISIGHLLIIFFAHTTFKYLNTRSEIEKAFACVRVRNVRTHVSTGTPVRFFVGIINTLGLEDRLLYTSVP